MIWKDNGRDFFSKLMKDMNPQVQETQRTPCKLNTKKKKKNE
jgi:hypothetical protein